MLIYLVSHEGWEQIMYPVFIKPGIRMYLPNDFLIKVFQLRFATSVRYIPKKECFIEFQPILIL